MNSYSGVRIYTRENQCVVQLVNSYSGVRIYICININGSVSGYDSWGCIDSCVFAWFMQSALSGCAISPAWLPSRYRSPVRGGAWPYDTVVLPTIGSPNPNRVNALLLPSVLPVRCMHDLWIHRPLSQANQLVIDPWVTSPAVRHVDLRDYDYNRCRITAYISICSPCGCMYIKFIPTTKTHPYLIPTLHNGVP